MLSPHLLQKLQLSQQKEPAPVTNGSPRFLEWFPPGATASPIFPTPRPLLLPCLIPQANNHPPAIVHRTMTPTHQVPNVASIPHGEAG